MIKQVIHIVFQVFIVSLSLTAILSSIMLSYILGFRHGVISATGEYESLLIKILEEKMGVGVPTPIPQPAHVPIPRQKEITWGGPDLWDEVNDKRVENGVNMLKQKDELCTIASIRLNELLEAGKIDNHEGFSDLAERREDLKWIFEKYSIAEFLLQGAETPEDAANMWYNTLGHKKIITGGEYTWGCIYAQDSFAVGIADY